MSYTCITRSSFPINYNPPPKGASDLYRKYTGDEKPTDEEPNPIIKDAQEVVDYWNEIRDNLRYYDKPAKYEIPRVTRQLDAALEAMMGLLEEDPSCEDNEFKKLFIRVFECREEAQNSPYNTELYV